jgi:prevent-host-death family protein
MQYNVNVARVSASLHFKMISQLPAFLDKVASRGYLRTMRKVGLKILKNKLSEYVRLAASGETVVVTDRGRAVAEIISPRREPESVIERGVREGWIRPAKRDANWPPPRKPIPGLTLEQLMAELDQDREDRW